MKTLKSCIKLIPLILGIYLIMVVTHNFWLPLGSWFLIQSQKLRKTELIVASTGSYGRFKFAVDMVKKKRADHLLLLGDRRIQTPVLGKSPLELAEEEAREFGIVSNKITVKHSTSTWMDALNTLEVMKVNNFHSGAVISDIYNMRRLAMIHNYIFQETNLNINYIAAETPWNSFHPDRWWLYPFEFEYVVKEWMKLSINYYHILLKK